MKQFLLFACLSVFSFGLTAQVYVDADANGSDDGSSWDNAYNDLADALEAADTGDEVWVAAGRYVTPADTSFVINKGISLIGGFAGDETDSDNTDPVANFTILSGDVDNDDVAGTYDSITRMDNQRVLFIADSSSTGSSFTANIEGFTIRDGNRYGYVPPVDNEEVPQIPFAGGGILATGRVNITNVNFENNYADFGSAVCIINDQYFSNADGTVLDNVTATTNYSGSRAIVYTSNTDDVVIRNSAFGSPNETDTDQGMVFALGVVDFTVEGCTFNNIVTTGRGGAIRVEGLQGLATIRDVSVANCEADLGGAIYLRNGQFDIFVDDEGNNYTGNTLIENVTLTNIKSSRWGGAVFISQVNSDIEGLSISNVNSLSGGGLGGALYLQSNADAGVVPLTIDWNNILIQEVVAGSAGGGIFVFADNDYEIEITNVEIRDVQANSSGGAFYLNGSGPAFTDTNVAILDSINIDNVEITATSGWGGGIITYANDVILTNSTFTNCRAGAGGGNGGGFYGEGDNIQVTIENSIFESNIARSGSGACVYGVDQQVEIHNTQFLRNGRSVLSGDAFRGGGLAFFHGGDNSEISIDSCLIAENTVTQDPNGASGGGAMYFNNIAAIDSMPSGDITVTNTRMELNNATDGSNGGAVIIIDGTEALFENTDMLSNSADQGGAIFTRLYTVNDTTPDNEITALYAGFDVLVKDAILYGNTAGSQGGAVCTQSSVINFTNTVFANNTVVEDGAGGGAIIFNGAGPDLDAEGELEVAPPSSDTANIVNCTFFGNSNSGSDGAAGNAIALFLQPNTFNDIEESMTVNLQNNAFFSFEDDRLMVELEPASTNPNEAFGNIYVNSLGGNFVNTESGEDTEGNMIFDAPSDIFSSDVDYEDLFEAPDGTDDDDVPFLRPLMPEENNPLIDAGTTGPLVPEYGILGNPRGDNPDIGAYELDWDVTSVQPVAESGLNLDIFPNPTADVVNIRSNDASITDYSVILTDNNGRVIRTQRYTGTTNSLNLAQLPNGVYTLQLVIDGKAYSQQLVKQ